MGRAFALILILLVPSLAEAAKLDEDSGCGTGTPSEHARAACALFSADERLAHEPGVQAAARACRAYYKHAAKSLNLVCSYRLESELLRARALTEGEAAVQEDARQLLAEASARMAKKFSKLELLHHDYGRALASFARQASELAHAEASCRSKEKRVPGVLLAGLAQAAHAHRVEVHRPLSKLAKEMADQSDLAYYATSSVLQFLGDRGGDLGAVMPALSCELTPIDRGPVGLEPRRPNSFLKEIAGRSAQTAFNQHVTKPLVMLFNPAANGLLTASLGSAFNLGNRVIKTGGNVDALDYASTGSALALQLGKSTVMRAHVAAVAIQGVEHLVRHYRYNTYRARAHAEFAKRFLEKRPEATSAELALAFAEETGGRHCEAAR